MRRGTPLKHKPYFGNISYDKLKDYEDCIQDMIFAYTNAEDYQKVGVLKSIYKDVSSDVIEAMNVEVVKYKPKLNLRTFKKKLTRK